ncbi:MAG: carboxypeptidase-like regulatory domain-containing protein [Candidatus Bathyarchaeia archaeon]
MRVTLLGLLICLMVLMGLCATLAAQEDEPYSPYGGGGVQGQILGFNLFDELIPVVWAEVSAYDKDGALAARVYSTGGGYYAMFLPVGWYTLTVVEPGYKTNSREIFVSSGSSTSINFVLELSFEPVHKPKPEPPSYYLFQIGLSGLPPHLRTKLLVDQVAEGDLASGATVDLRFEAGTTHTITVEKVLEREGERYTTESPSLTVSTAGSHVFRYEAEYLLTFSTDPEGLRIPQQPEAGWHPAGATIITSKAPDLIEGAEGVRYRFKAWSLDGSDMLGNPSSFTMDRPHFLKAVYSTEYLVEVSSPYGTPSGSGWYPAGSTATISIQPSEGFLIRHVFAGWTGSYTGTEPLASFTVSRPMKIEASWATDYTVAVVLIMLATAAAAAALILIARRSAPQPPQNLPSHSYSGMT